MGQDANTGFKLDDITKKERETYGVSALATRPNAPSRYGEGGLTAKELKAKFDALSGILADRINKIHAYLKASDLDENINVTFSFGQKALSALASDLESGEAAKYIKVHVNAEATDTLQEVINGILGKVATNAENIDKAIAEIDLKIVPHDAADELVFTAWDKTGKVVSTASAFVQNAEYYIADHNSKTISDGVHPYLVGLIQENGMQIDVLKGNVATISGKIEDVLSADIGKMQKQIYNLLANIPAEYFVTDGADAYTKKIPTTALPWAELQEVGGTTNPDGQVGKVTALEIIGTNRLNISGMLNECLRDNGDGTYTLTKVSSDGRFTAIVPLFAPVGQQLYNTFEVVDTNIPNFNNSIPLQMLDASGKNEVSSVGIVDGDGGWYTAGGGSVYVRSYLEASYPVGSYITFRNPMVQFAEYYKAPLAPYSPYRKYTITIPAEVQNLQGYGQGNPTGTEYNYIDFVRRVFVQKGYRDANGYWIPTGREIDISAYLPADNLIEVEGNGSITFVNAYQLPVPSKIEYQLKEANA